jgi:hypothetical protein
LARFGDVESLFADTPAEQFCIKALAGVKRDRQISMFLDDDETTKRFKAHLDLIPHTLSDCLHELAYWHDLYSLRSASGGGDQVGEAYARESFAFRCLAEIRPRDKVESVAVLRYMTKRECMNRKETDAILLNLIG